MINKNVIRALKRHTGKKSARHESLKFIRAISDGEVCRLAAFNGYSAAEVRIKCPLGASYDRFLKHSDLAELGVYDSPAQSPKGPKLAAQDLFDKITKTPRANTVGLIAYNGANLFASAKDLSREGYGYDLHVHDAGLIVEIPKRDGDGMLGATICLLSAKF